ncbi:glycosyl hydrolase [Endomicrobium proavitum]|nr:glycosyl hydrolase [Endomicrobium proavitum]
MKKSLLKVLSIVLLTAACVVPAAFGQDYNIPAPTITGAGAFGTNDANLTNQMPKADLKMSSQTRAYPTNRWWGSMIFTNSYHNFSLAMNAAPMAVNFNTGAKNWWEIPGAGYVIGHPDLSYTASPDMLRSSGGWGIYVLGHNGDAGGTGTYGFMTASTTFVKNYSDWAFTAIVQDRNRPQDKLTATIVKGSPFTYNYYTASVKPSIIVTNGSITLYNNVGTPSTGTFTGDRVIVMVNDGTKYQYYGVYAPASTGFTRQSTTELRLTLPSAVESERYVSVALLYSGASENLATAKSVFDEYYKYAYNFVTNTQASWTLNNNASITTTFNVTLTAKRTGGSFVSGQTVFALYPHQHKNLDSASPASYYSAVDFKTLRGTMKIYRGSSFKTKYNFNGMLPALPYETPEANKSKIQTYLDAESNINLAATTYRDTYYGGKIYEKVANMIPIAHMHGDIATKNSLINKLKTELVQRYSNNSARYFLYDQRYGGIQGYHYLAYNNEDFGSRYYNDHHFHYGMFVYASAILAMFDPDFASSSQYQSMVNAVIKDFANADRNDVSFPFLRYFDVYEGHSWANGRGTTSGDDGTDQESSSEAMNAWAGIYLWGVATNNPDLIALGIYLYTTEYAAIKEYFFDMDGTTYSGTPWAHKSIGRLYDNRVSYDLWWTPQITQTILGIQVLPLTPSMLYLGYNPTFSQSFYNEMWNGRDTGGNANLWKDIWLRYKSLFDGAGALTDWNSWNPTSSSDAEFGSSLTLSYHFINFFNKLGTVNTNYYATESGGAVVPFTTMQSASGPVYIAYNNSNAYKTVNFYTKAGASVGSAAVPPYTTIQTGDFNDYKYDSLRAMYSTNTWYALAVDKYGDSVRVSSIAAPPVNSTYYVTLPAVFRVTHSNATFDPMAGYVSIATSTVPDGYSPSDIKLVKYNGASLAEVAGQSVTLNAKDARIAANFTSTGTYLLVIQKPITLLSGTVKNNKGNTNLNANLLVWSSVDAASTTVAANGSYSNLELSYGGNYTVTPALANFIFEPAVFAITPSSVGVTLTQNFTGFAVSKTSGNVTNNIGGAAANATVYIYDVTANSTITKSAAGWYVAENLIEDRNYVITPVADRFIFAPSSFAFTATAANKIQHFTAYAISNTSGVIKNNKDNSNVAATVYIKDVAANTVSTKTVNGFYATDNLVEGRNYVINIEAPNFLFVPSSYAFSASASDEARNFAAFAVSRSSGTIKNNIGGANVNANIYVYDVLANSTATKSANGWYQTDYLYESKNYVLTPFADRFMFVPSSVAFAATNADVVYSFTGYALSKTSGTIKNNKDNSNVNASMSVYDTAANSTNTFSSGSGFYATGWLTEGKNYVVTPQADRFKFSPVNTAVNASNLDIYRNFIATALSIASGTIKNNAGGGNINATVYIYDVVANSSATKSANGFYVTDWLDEGKNFIITPAANRFKFVPQSASFTAAAADVFKNFTGYALSVTSGVVKNNIGGANVNANIYVYDVLANSTITKSANGFYATDDLTEGQNYIITAKAAGFKFLPQSYAFTAGSADAAKNFTGYALSYATVTLKNAQNGANVNVNIKIYDSLSNSTNTIYASGGAYVIEATEGLSYAITPDDELYEWTPASWTFTATTANRAQIFSGAVKKILSGNITNNINSAPLAINLNIFDVALNSTITKTGVSSYSTGLVYGKQYVVTPSLANFMFVPSSFAFTAGNVDITQNFTGYALSKTSGTVKNNTGGANVNATIYIYDIVANSTATKSATGFYASDNLIEGRNYIITPQAANFRFEPQSVNLTATNADVFRNFTGYALSKTTGTVLNNKDSSAVSANIHIYSVVANSTVTKSANGFYITDDLDQGKNYVITPIANRFMFVPEKDTFTATTSNRVANFTGYAVSITSGVVKNNIGGANVNATVYIWDAVANSTITKSANGFYASDNLIEGRNYVITPQAANFRFTPQSVSFTATSADTYKNFTGYAISKSSGTIKNNIGGANVNATVYIWDVVANSTVTKSANGFYITDDLDQGKNYVITPIANRFMFVPEKDTFTATTSNRVANFTGYAVSITSGVVKNNIGGANVNATVYIWDAVANSTITKSANGFYASDNLIEGRNYVITPQAANFRFTPQSVSFTATSADTYKNFTGYAISKSSGTIKNNIGGANVNATVYIWDVVANSTVTKSANGFYITDDLDQGKNYVITPIANRFMFVPEKDTFTATTSNRVANFTGYAVSITSGVVKNNIGGANVNATVYIWDAVANSTITKSANGFYASDNLIEGRNYVITPQAANFRFTPQSVSFTATSADTYKNFTGYAISKSSGTIKNNIGGANVNATVYIWDVVANSTVTKSANGFYITDDLDQGKNYVITPVANRFMFVPEKDTFTATTLNRVTNFTGFALSFATGTLKNVANNSNVNVSVRVYDVSANSATIINNANGFYSARVIEGRNYIITPDNEFYEWTPASWTFTAGATDKIQNFVGAKKTAVTGTIKNNIGATNINANIYIYDGTATTTKTVTGSYSAGLVFGKTYTLTPKADRFIFVPASWTFTADSSDKVQNFTGKAISWTSGTVRNNKDNSNVNATVYIWDVLANSTAAVINANGFYSSGYLIEGQNYVITPTAANFIFVPAASTFTATSADALKNFTGFALSKSSGTIKNNTGGANVSATVYIYDVLANSTATKSANGFYATDDLIEGRNYVITPVANRFVFVPQRDTFTAASVNRELNFTGYATSILSGTVKGAVRTNQNIAGQMRVYDNFTNSTNVYAFDGRYEVNTVEGYKYELAPFGSRVLFTTAAGVFNASTFAYTATSQDKRQDFVAYALTKASATILNNIGNTAAWADVYLYDAAANSTLTWTHNTGGANETQDLIEGRNYVISVVPYTGGMTPVNQRNFIFKPSSVAFTAATADRFDAIKAYRFTYISATVTNVQYATAVVSGMMHITDSFFGDQHIAFASTHTYVIVEGMSYAFAPEAASHVIDAYSFTVNSVDSVLDHVFMAYPSYAIGGQITFSNGSPAAGIEVDIYNVVAGSTNTVVTGSNGTYSFNGVYNSSYTVTARSGVYKFNVQGYDTGALVMPQPNLNFTVAAEDTKIVAYPNPYKPFKHTNGGIKFTNVKQGAKIKVYNIAMEKVFEDTVMSDGQYLWNVINNYGNDIGSGIYIYHIDVDGKISKGKIAIER